MPQTPLSDKVVHRVLVVDDDVRVRTLHSRLCERLGYHPEMAADGIEALAKLALGVDLVMLDGQMPRMDGFEVARRIRAQPEHATLPIVMVTGLEGQEEYRRAMEVGINDFIKKPIDVDLFRLRSRWLLDLKHARDSLSRQNRQLDGLVEERTEALRHALEEVTEARRRLYSAHLDTIRRLTVAAEFKDTDTAAHIERIGLYSEVLAGAMGLSPGTVETMRHAAPMHDVGKIGIPDHVLLKPGKLSDSEWNVMRSHTTLGAALLDGSDSEVLQMGQRIALSHHERWDGNGYPEGRAHEDIPVEARICAVVDYFDALTMDRPYRKALPVDQVLDMMRNGFGTHFDPSLLRVTFACVPDFIKIRSGDPAAIGRKPTALYL